LAVVAVKGKWGVIDKSGSFVVKPTYSHLESFREGRAVFRAGTPNGARYGFLDKNGVEVIPAIFRDARSFSEGLAAAKIGDLWGYIDPSGIFRITPRFEDGAPSQTGTGHMPPGYFGEGLAPLWSGRGYGFIDTTGRFSVEGAFDEAESFCNRRALVRHHGRYGFLDPEGRMAIEARFTYASDFSEGLAAVRLEEYRVGFVPPSGFIDVAGRLVLRPIFHSTERFIDGLCLVTTDDSIRYINTEGERVWEGPYVEYGVLC
jgi:hypothetical protein